MGYPCDGFIQSIATNYARHLWQPTKTYSWKLDQDSNLAAILVSKLDGKLFRLVLSPEAPRIQTIRSWHFGHPSFSSTLVGWIASLPTPYRTASWGGGTCLD